MFAAHRVAYGARAFAFGNVVVSKIVATRYVTGDVVFFWFSVRFVSQHSTRQSIGNINSLGKRISYAFFDAIFEWGNP